MKRFVIYLIVFPFIFGACKKEKITPKTSQVQKENIPFTGTWQRQFEAGAGNLHTVNYLIYQDSIRYTLAGPIGNANYVMLRDTFLLTQNRFIGHTPDNQHYLIFVKNFNNDSLTLYKQAISDVSEGMNTTAPSDTTTANHGWNTYYKQ